ncbi:XdhC family protein [Naumannella halotolerans]|uniref:Xanthine dehydrogenase accessory factor n=1 Tax=Naumannella halotolerans TaxID=993414 RepID=A0A4R7IYJ5_9ACTN|nr:XdhC/CoxI family protein [Naumannella halotolerans]TDT29842.1 xanthine dehydrogenase accessory factor [Naumannella halotolerans]
MLELADRLSPLISGDRPFVTATVIGVDGSAPHVLGSSMVFDGESVIGSIAAGCVEGAVVDVAERVLDDRRTRIVSFGVADDDLYAAGLSCGGELRIHLSRVDPHHPGAAGVLAALARVRSGQSARLLYSADGFGGRECDAEFVETRTPPAQFLIVGAMEYSTALSAAAQALDYRVTVCDPRALFTTQDRFPGTELVVAWPPRHLAAAQLDSRSVICVLSHDDRFDAETIALALRSPAGYVGAMGSRRTHERRMRALLDLGLSDEELTRLHSPIGLDLGASTPAETAISILAEVLAQRNGTSGRPLRTGEGAIHGNSGGRSRSKLASKSASLSRLTTS